jgi:predicted Rossmann-fold nucleotide-binding protein
VWTWAQLGLHRKPCGLLDADGFFQPLVGFLDHLVLTGFVQSSHRGMLHTAQSPEALLAAFAAYQAPLVAKWVNPAQA